MGNFPDHLNRLIEHFDQQSDQVRSPDYNEAQLRIDFVNPLFAALGWDMDNSQHFAEQYREVVHEDRVKVAGQTKAPDYSFRVGGVRKFFLEAKKPAVKLKDAWEPAYQLRRYGWSAKLPVSILTNFEELAIYDCRIAPKQFDKSATARREYITYREYPERWDFLLGTFSKQAVLQGEFDRYCQTAKGRGRQEFDDTFLEEIEEWRKSLAANLALRNDNLDEPGLNFAVQRIIDRIIFLRMAEDRGTESTGQLQALLAGEQTYPRLQKLFRDADARYNSGLFHFTKEPGRDEAPDTLTPGVEIDDRTLKEIIDRLYYPKSPYEFTVVTADILGSVYERFLGKVITLTPGHRARIEEKPEVRKAGGVYYTPTYIVDYIVKNTVGKLLDGPPPLTPADAKKLKILDPACGSGSFLIGAYQYLLDWHLAQYTAADPQSKATGKNPVLRPTDTGGWKLTISERKRILLDNIHGVDLDAAAVEVTKLNLLLKCLEGETSQTLNFQRRLWHDRALPDLGHNILCGNSLIGTDIMATDAWGKMSDDEKRRINPFDYERAFGKVFKQGGFDAVVGNPPYLFITEVPAAQRPYYESHFTGVSYRFDLYGAFIEKSVKSLLGRGGEFGFIIPHTLLSNDSFRALRSLLAERITVSEVLDFGPGVFQGARNETMLLFFKAAPATQGATVKVIRTTPKLFPEVSGQTSPRLAGWVKGNGDPWLVFAADSHSRLLAKMKTAAEQTFGDLCTINQGLRTGNNGGFLAAKSSGKKWKPAVGGKDVARYEPLLPARYVLYDPPLLDAPRRAEIFESPEKIIVQEIRNIALPRRIVATLDRSQVYCLQSTNVINKKPDCTYAIEYLLAILNSDVVNTFFRYSFSGNNHIASNQLAQIPCPNATAKDETSLVRLVRRILSLAERRGAVVSPHEADRLQREIDATDRQIDEAVYGLYGLTKVEMQVVEGATSKRA